MSGDLRFKHDAEARGRACLLFASGLGHAAAARELALPRQAVRKWEAKWRAFGSEVLLEMSTTHARYSYEQKVAAASAVVDGGMARADAMREFGVAAASTLDSWVARYRGGGPAALAPRPRGRPRGPSARPRTREQELEERCRRLEAEVAYLKKFRSLVGRGLP